MMVKIEPGIYNGDCAELFSMVPPKSVRLTFADPPFNLDRPYDVCEDRLPDDQYLQWTEDWISAMLPIMTDDASFWFCISEKYVAEAKMICTRLGLHLRNWIVWHYTFGQNMRTQFARSNTHILYFVADPKNFVFNDMQVRIPSERHFYGDRRAHPDGKIPDSTWDDFSRVCGTFVEKQAWHDNQMPEALMHRIIRVASDEGDTILDPFSGSGTTAAAAARLGREFVCFDISEDYCIKGMQRVRDAVADPENTIGATGQWGLFHRETAEQFFREAGVSAVRLMDNEQAFTCFCRLLNIRCKASYTEDDIRGILPSLEKRAASKKRGNRE